MTLISKLEQDYIAAYKTKDAVRLNVLRLLKTALKNFQVEHMRAPSDSDAIDIINRQCKQRQDSIEQFSAANRPELVKKEAAELDILRSYLPEPLSERELVAAINSAIFSVSAESVKDMGRVMQVLTTSYKGRFDGKVASDAVRSALQSRA